MASGIFTFYSANKHLMSFYALDTVTIKLALVTSAYIPDILVPGDGVISDIGDNELPTGGGYIVGGITLENAVYSAMSSNYGYKFTSNEVKWTASGEGIPAWRYAVMYVSGTFGGVSSPLIGYFLGDSNDIDVPITASGDELIISCPIYGWFAIT